MRDHRRHDTLIAVLAIALTFVVGGTAYVLSEVNQVRASGDAVRQLAKQAQDNADRALRENPLQ